MHKDQLKNQYSFYPEITKELERDVFHGTSEAITSKILAGGFNPIFCSQAPERTVHGKGCYFARDISYSAQNRYAAPNEDGHKFVFIARLLIGAIFNVSLRSFM